jgi:hypothetical protein
MRVGSCRIGNSPMQTMPQNVMIYSRARPTDRQYLMQHEILDYATPEPRPERPPLVVLAAVAPPVMFVIYFFGTIFLYEVLNNGSRSVYRAAGWMALPTGLVTFVALVIGMAEWIRPVRSRRAAIFATIAGVVFLAAIVLTALPWD